MTTQQQHPITPPPELVEQWRNLPEYTNGRRKMIMVTISIEKLLDIATQAAQWGADAELNECCHLLRLQGFDVVDDLRAARRPKPPSLKEQALEALSAIEKNRRRASANQQRKPSFNSPSIRGIDQ